MEPTDMVEVLSFRTFDIEAGEMRLSKFKATRHAIVASLGGEVLEGTEQDVSHADLDEHGHYRRIATGWGGLS